MLQSPPLTVDSGLSSPRCVKRIFQDTFYDATPPASQPLKRRRCSTSAPLAEYQECRSCDATDFFDPSRLVTPPEYAHVPYDPDFGRKVCQQYKRSLKTKYACDAVTQAARRHKYGQAALEYSPGSTPDHIRSSYEAKQRRLDKMAEDIIANSDSEADSDSEASSVMDWTMKMRSRRRRAPEYHADIPPITSQESGSVYSAAHHHSSKTKTDKSTPFHSRNDITAEKITNHDGVGIVFATTRSSHCMIIPRGRDCSRRERRAHTELQAQIRIC